MNVNDGKYLVWIVRGVLMASLQEYCRKLSTGALEDLVFGDMDAYPKEVLRILCRELLARDPDRLDVLKVLWQFADEE